MDKQSTEVDFVYFLGAVLTAEARRRNLLHAPGIERPQPSQKDYAATATGICRGFVFSARGMRSVSTPFLNSAWIFSSSTVSES